LEEFFKVDADFATTILFSANRWRNRLVYTD
jgi:hypothetical protein